MAALPLKIRINFVRMHRLCFFSISFLLCLPFFAQLRPVKPATKRPATTTLAFGGGITRSVVYLSRNVKDNNDALGYHLTMTYGGAQLTRLSVEFTSYKLLNIEPTWYNVRASTVEANMHFLARFR